MRGETRQHRRVGREGERRRHGGIEPSGSARTVTGVRPGTRVDHARGEPDAHRRALGLVPVGSDVHHLTDLARDARLLERLACRRLAHVLVPLDVAARQAPEPRAEMSRPALHHEDAASVVEHYDGGADAHVGEEGELARRAERPLHPAARPAFQRRSAAHAPAPVVTQDHAQSLGPSYLAMSGSWVTIVSRSSTACATSRRSNGSRWWLGRVPRRTVWAIVTGSSSKLTARMARTTSPTLASIFRSAALIAISQVLAALTYTSVSASRMLFATRAGSRRGLLRTQMSACVSSRSLAVTASCPRRDRGRHREEARRSLSRPGSFPAARQGAAARARGRQGRGVRQGARGE